MAHKFKVEKTEHGQKYFLDGMPLEGLTFIRFEERTDEQPKVLLELFIEFE